MPASIFISVLLILILTTCAGADEVKLTASDGAAHDEFGYSVSISGDYAIIGAYLDDDNGDDSGSAYIYKRDGTTWNQQAKITASDGEEDDYFGQYASISGDYVVVGARGDDDRGASSGSAYIFKRDGTTWSQQAKIMASDGAAGNRFGYSASISGDYVIVGARGYDDSGASSGAAYIFKRDGTTWSQQAKLTVSDDATGDLFGYSASISGDYALVGAYLDDDCGVSSGSAYIFKLDETTWGQQAKMTASDGGAIDHFGFSVSISGDYATMSAPWDDDTGGDSGSVYTYKRSETEWSRQAKLTASDGVMYDRFGFSISSSGDYVIVGAYSDDGHGKNSGSAYIFNRDGATWFQQAKLTASDGATNDYFGQSVSSSGDYVIVGAYSDDDDDGENSGSAYIYDIQTPELPTAGDLNGDVKIIATGDVPSTAVTKTPVDAEPVTNKTDVPGFGAMFAIIGLFVTAYLVLKRQE